MALPTQPPVPTPMQPQPPMQPPVQPQPPMQPPTQLPTPTLAQTGGIAPGPHRIHPAYVILNAVRVGIPLLVAILVGIGSAFPAYTSNPYATSRALPDFINNTIGLAGLLVVLVVLILVPVAVISFIYYKRFLWEITVSDVHVYSGIIFKKQVHIPFQRVQSIDFQASLIERTLGIVKLKIETAGGAANKAVLIPALKLGEAEALRADVFRRKRAVAEARMQQTAGARAAGAAGAAGVAGVAGVAAAAGLPPVAGTGLPPVAGTAPTGAPLPFGTTYPPPTASSMDVFVNEVGQMSGDFRGLFASSYNEDAPIEYEFGLSAKELVLSAISSDHNYVVFAVILGFLSQVPQFINLFGYGSAAEQLVVQNVTSQTLPFVIAGVVIFALFLFLLTIVGTAINYGGFECRRRGGRIEVEHGLLARQYKGVAIKRVQSIEIRQGFIRRLMGYAELRFKTIDSAGEASQTQAKQSMQTAGLIVHPFVKMEKVAGILHQLIPEYNDCPTAEQTRRLPAVARRRAFNRLTLIPMLIVAVVLLAIDLFVLVPYAPATVTQPLLIISWTIYGIVFALCVVASLLWYRHASYGYNNSMLYLRQGSYSMVTSIIPRKKIQWAGNHQNPLQRLAKVATITARTAAGVGGTTTTLRDLPLAEATAYTDWLRPRGRG